MTLTEAELDDWQKEAEANAGKSFYVAADFMLQLIALARQGLAAAPTDPRRTGCAPADTIDGKTYIIGLSPQADAGETHEEKMVWDLKGWATNPNLWSFERDRLLAAAAIIERKAAENDRLRAENNRRSVLHDKAKDQIAALTQENERQAARIGGLKKNSREVFAECEKQIAALTQERDRLREALEPFVQQYELNGCPRGTGTDDDTLKVPIWALRQARQALGSGESK